MTLTSARLKAFVWFPPLRGMYQRGGTCKGCNIRPLMCLKPLERIQSKAWRGQGRILDPGGCPDCDRTTWEDSGLPSLQTKSQVDSSGKYRSAITNRHRATERRSL